MSASVTDFVGTIPFYYDQFLAPLIVEPYGPELARRISAPSGDAVLEIAAGTGSATRHLRNALSDNVRITVTDLNAPMLAYARRKFPAAANMEFRTADAARLDFPDASFDAVACQFSLMFFPNKAAAIREMARVLRPGGIFVFSLWDSYQQNHLIRTVNAELGRLFPERRLDFFDTPYGYHDASVLQKLLAENGFASIQMDVVPLFSRCNAALDVALGYVLGTPVCLQIVERDGLPVEEAVKCVEHAVGEAHGYHDVCAPMQAVLFKAQRQGAENL